MLRKLLSSPRLSGSAREQLAARQSKGTIELTLAPSRVRNPPRPKEICRGVDAGD